MRSQSLAVDLATTEGENLKSLARKTWAFWDLRVVSPGLRSCATRFWVWAMCFFHINLTRTSVNTTYFGGNSRLPGRILEWWLHRARHIRHISKKCRSCARIFECLTTNLLSFMSWWFGRVKTALNHQRFGSANWMTPSQHWSTSWNQVLGCPIPISFNVFFENGTTQFFISMNIASRPDPITFWYILFVYHPWCHAEDAEDS
jgi:hypothetical protein